MAERSFAQEVGKLRLGEGEEFHGEAILAVTKALLQSGVGYVGGYQGAPISHLMDVLSDAQDVLEDLGVRFEASASEAAAAAMLAASVNYPIRGAVTWKSTVGTNVASDALANVASGGVTGGALVIVGEDYGEGSSIMQERSHAFAMKSQMWLLDPRPNLESIVDDGGARFRALRGIEHAGDAGVAHPRLPCVRPLSRRRTTVRPRSACAMRSRSPCATRHGSCCRPPISRTSGEDREALAGRRRLRPRAPLERIHGRRLGRYRDHLAGRPLQHAPACARALGTRRCLRPHRAAALCPQCHLSADRRGDPWLLRGQARRAHRRRGSARVHRAAPQHGAASSRRADSRDRQGRAAAGRRIHGAGPRAWRRGVPRAPCAAMARLPGAASRARAGSIASPPRKCRRSALCCPCGRRDFARAAPSGPFSRR